MNSLNESNVPIKVFQPGLEKHMCILHEKFNFATTTKVKVNCFKSLKPSPAALLEMKFPMLISVESKLATYHHVVVVWQQRVIDYESMFTYPLTEEYLRQICGVNSLTTNGAHMRHCF
jgi:hypothetical protein